MFNILISCPCQVVEKHQTRHNGFEPITRSPDHVGIIFTAVLTLGVFDYVRTRRRIAHGVAVFDDSTLNVVTRVEYACVISSRQLKTKTNSTKRFTTTVGQGRRRSAGAVRQKWIGLFVRSAGRKFALPWYSREKRKTAKTSTYDRKNNYYYYCCTLYCCSPQGSMTFPTTSSMRARCTPT